LKLEGTPLNTVLSLSTLDLHPPLPQSALQLLVNASHLDLRLAAESQARFVHDQRRMLGLLRSPVAPSHISGPHTCNCRSCAIGLCRSFSALSCLFANTGTIVLPLRDSLGRLLQVLLPLAIPWIRLTFPSRECPNSLLLIPSGECLLHSSFSVTPLRSPSLPRSGQHDVFVYYHRN
jgi:hypothetical protein